MMAQRVKAVAPGFTMIELVMVILILGIVSITLLPRFSSPDVFSQRGYYDDLLQSLTYARSVALARGCRVQAVLYTNDFYFMQDVDCDSTSYLRSDYTQPLMRPDQSTRLEFNAYDDPDEGHSPIELAAMILIFEPSGRVSQDTSGSLSSFESLTMTAGTGTLRIYGDTGYVD